QLGDGALDFDDVAEARRPDEAGAGIDHGNAGNAVMIEPIALVHGKGGREQRGAGIVEEAEIIGIVDNAGRVAIAELDFDPGGVGEHDGSYLEAMRSAPSSRTTSPLR